MIFDKKQGRFYSETGADNAWVQRAWAQFLRELVKLNIASVSSLCADWGIQVIENRPFIRNSAAYLKANPKAKKEQDLRNKLARETAKTYEKINKLWEKKDK